MRGVCELRYNTFPPALSLSLFSLTHACTDLNPTRSYSPQTKHHLSPLCLSKSNYSSSAKLRATASSVLRETGPASFQCSRERKLCRGRERFGRKRTTGTKYTAQPGSSQARSMPIIGGGGGRGCPEGHCKRNLPEGSGSVVLRFMFSPDRVSPRPLDLQREPCTDIGAC